MMMAEATEARALVADLEAASLRHEAEFTALVQRHRAEFAAIQRDLNELLGSPQTH